MTAEERLSVIESQVRQQGDRLERHSVRLEKLERTSESVEEIKADVSSLKKEFTALKKHQAITDKKLLKKSNWTIGLLLTIVGLIVYIAFKSPATAKEVVDIVGKTVVTGVTTL